MPGNDIGNRKFTGYPFGLKKFEYENELRYFTVAQLEDELEIKRWIVIDPDAEDDFSLYFFSDQIQAILQELDRRRKLLQAKSNHPLAPKWKGGSMTHQRERIERIKARWPIDLFLQQSLGRKLTRRSNSSYVTNCPFPGHEDSTPSFKVNMDKGYGYCFGCQRGGDVIEIARYYLNTNSFTETLAALEKEGEIFDARK